MNKEEKLNEVKLIRSLLLEEGNDDEINTRIWCLIDPDELVEDFNVDYLTVLHENKINGSKVPQYTKSLDACRSIQQEGWSYTLFYSAKADFFRIWEGERVEISSFRSITIERAWLDAILQVMKWEISNDD